MRKYVLILSVVFLTGCEVARGFERNIGQQLPGLVVEAVDTKFGDRFDDIEEKISGLPAPTPAPEPEDNTLGYGIGALLAYIIGSVGKGMIRDKLAKK